MSFLIGIFTGIFGGIAGVGGGAVMVPLMVALLKISQHKAHGTSLLALVFTGIMGAISYGVNGSIDLVAVGLIVSTAMFTSRAGVRVCHALPEGKLRRYYGAFAIIVALSLLLKPYLPHLAHPVTGWTKVVLLLLTGAVTGFQSGMMGGGGGVVMVPILVLMGGFGQHLAQGISLAVMIPVGCIGALSYVRLGLFEGHLLKGLIPGILAGTYAGASVAHLLPDNALRIIFSIIIAALGIRSYRSASSCELSPKSQNE